MQAARVFRTAYEEHVLGPRLTAGRWPSRDSWRSGGLPSRGNGDRGL